MARDCKTAWQYYSQTAAGYDELHGEEQLAKTRAIISLAKPQKGWKVLDVGCGTGVSMQGWPCAIVGVEPSKEMASVAAKKGLEVVVAQAEDLPFPDDSFDLAIAVTSAHHFRPEAFKEMARVAKRAVISMLAKAYGSSSREAIGARWDIVAVQECPPDVILDCRRKAAPPPGPHR